MPFVLDAYRLGFLPGYREDSSYQADQYRNLNIDVGFLDNDFRNPDLERYLEEFRRADPSVAVIGDAYNKEEAELYQEAVEELREEYPNKTYVVAPKCRSAFEILDEEIVLGVPIGYSDQQPLDIAGIDYWRGRKLHLLGGSPPKQFEAVQQFTQPTLNDHERSEIVGVDWNGIHKVAYMGEHWSCDGYVDADDLSIRETVKRSLEEIKRFWQSKDLWPGTELQDLAEPPVKQPRDNVFHGSGRRIKSDEELWNAYVVEAEDMTYGFESSVKKDFVAWREGILK